MLNWLAMDIQQVILQRLLERLQKRVTEQSPQSVRPQRQGATSVPVTPFDALIEQASAKYGVDPQLVKSVIKVESNFDPEAVSHAGAKGLMQLMDATAADLGVEDSFDVAQNIHGGVAYLAQQLRRFHGDVRLALAAYNAGPGTVARYQDVPPIAETQSYVQRVLSFYQGETGQGIDFSA